MMGMFYDRRNSEAGNSPSQKSNLSNTHGAMPSTCASAGSISMDASKIAQNICLPDQHPHPEQEEQPALDYIYSEKRVCFSGHQHYYEYLDTPASLVGHGSYGTVFKGLDHQTNDIVAVKKMARINVKPDELETMKRVSNPTLSL
uniref:Protein kinase domain-containing protein n=1 Tax=Ditylenchus dipsaci TaxID=166011 RepID=A0A915CTN6_9BILA